MLTQARLKLRHHFPDRDGPTRMVGGVTVAPSHLQAGLWTRNVLSSLCRRDRPSVSPSLSLGESQSAAGVPTRPGSPPGRAELLVSLSHGHGHGAAAVAATRGTLQPPRRRQVQGVVTESRNLKRFKFKFRARAPSDLTRARGVGLRNRLSDGAGRARAY